MAQYGEWNRKGATLSDVTEIKEYGVSREFIEDGIRACKLEYREGSVWGSPFLRVLRSQLEQHITDSMGSQYLARKKREEELRKIKREIAQLKKSLTEIQTRKAEIEAENGE